jgi:hypothetical protein
LEKVYIKIPEKIWKLYYSLLTNELLKDLATRKTTGSYRRDFLSIMNQIQTGIMNSMPQ